MVEITFKNKLIARGHISYSRAKEIVENMGYRLLSDSIYNELL